MLEKITALITNYIDIDPSEINENSRFMDDIGFNSYDFMCMLGDCEDEFDIEIDEAEAANSKTVGELIKYLGGLG